MVPENIPKTDYHLSGAGGSQCPQALLIQRDKGQSALPAVLVIGNHCRILNLGNKGKAGLHLIQRNTVVLDFNETSLPA